MPSATLSATSFKPWILGRDLLLEALGALVQRTDAGNRRNQRHVTLGLAIFRADRGGETVGGDATALHIIGL